MTKDDSQKAITYGRVARTPNSRDAAIILQEERCCEFARQEGYEVVAAFHDIGFSGSGTDRPSLNKMLAFLSDQRDPAIVIVDHTRVLARNFDSLVNIHRAIEERGAVVRSANFDTEGGAAKVLLTSLSIAMAEFEDKTAALRAELDR